jgi:hypothetical protein
MMNKVKQRKKRVRRKVAEVMQNPPQSKVSNSAGGLLIEPVHGL